MSTRRLSVVGLFAGIGGLERGLASAGHQTLGLCELDPGAHAVLSARFPSVPVHRDVRELAQLPRGTEAVVAGFPCQDLSQAGRTAGIRGRNSGLVSEVFRLLETSRVPLVVLENVPFMLQLGRGRALRVIVDELERLGYSWAYRVVDTRAFGLPQRRQRVLLVAALDEAPEQILLREDAGAPEEPGLAPELAHGFYWTEGLRGLGWAVDAVPTLKGGSSVGVPSPPAIWLPDDRIVTPDIRDAERLQGFPKDWTKPATRAVRAGYRWRLVGNAVSVPVARWLGRQLARADAAACEPPGTRPLPAGPWPRVAWGAHGRAFTADVSAWPKRTRRKHLHAFLSEEPRPLSRRATVGFRERLRRSTLRVHPEFLRALDQHLERAEG